MLGKNPQRKGPRLTVILRSIVLNEDGERHSQRGTTGRPPELLPRVKYTYKPAFVLLICEVDHRSVYWNYVIQFIHTCI